MPSDPAASASAASKQAKSPAELVPVVANKLRPPFGIVLGTLAGAGGFATLMLAGWLLYRRLWGDSATALLVGLLWTLIGASGSANVAVPTCTDDAPAIMNSSAS